jgi:predicted Zn-dependent peptidase
MKFLRRKLKNGMTVIMEKRDLPLVALSITNRFGAAFEESKIKGIAHVIEHSLFTGTETRTHEDISREIEKKGGILNAFTTHVPSEHLFAGLDILIDMLKNPKFDEKKFEKEKKVILEEIKMYHDNPRFHVFEQIEKNMFEKPFGELIIGSKETVSGLDRDFVVDYFKKMYSPENFIVTVVGNGDFDEICELLEKSFESGERKIEIIPVKKKNKETVEERPGIDQAHFVFAVHAPLPDEDDYYALEVLDAYLANGMSSRLFLEIREKRGLAYSVRSSIDSEKSYSSYNIYVGTTKEKVDEVKKIILEEFDKVKDMTENDLKEAKERMIGLKEVSKEESSSVMNELMFAELVNKAEDYYEYEKKIRKVKLEDVKRMAKIDKFSSAAVVPK